MKNKGFWLLMGIWAAVAAGLFFYHLPSERNVWPAVILMMIILSMIYSLMLSIPFFTLVALGSSLLSWQQETDPAKKAAKKKRAILLGSISVAMVIGFIVGFIIASPFDKPWAALTASMLMAAPLVGIFYVIKKVVDFFTWLARKVF